MKMSNRKFYIICAIFSIGAIFLIITSESREDILASIVGLLFFGVGGICYYFLDKKGNKEVEYNGEKRFIEKRSTNAVLMIACLVFVIAGYFLLPFHHIFDGTWRYTPTIGWIIGMAAILFFGAGFIISIMRMINPRIVMRISDKSFCFADGIKKTKTIDWKNVRGISKNDLFFLVFYEDKDKIRYECEEDKIRSAKIPLSSINHYNIEQIENLIMDKIKNASS